MKIIKYENEKLDPCPFCGGDGAILIKYGGEYKIFCGTAECDAQFGWCDDKEHVIKSWNHRSNVADNTKNKTREAMWLINSDGYYPYCSACMTEPQIGDVYIHKADGKRYVIYYYDGVKYGLLDNTGVYSYSRNTLGEFFTFSGETVNLNSVFRNLKGG